MFISQKIKYNETLYYYDVNGLYPIVMSKFFMPVGKPIGFLSDIRYINPNAFGFFYCKFTSPQYLDHPILQSPKAGSIKTVNGLRTIAGLGS
jgi:DNA polymerase type B, organellar and viral